MECVKLHSRWGIWAELYTVAWEEEVAWMYKSFQMDELYFLVLVGCLVL